MWIDPLVEEVRQRRRELMADFDYNPEKVLENLKREREKYFDRLSGSPKTKSSIHAWRASVEGTEAYTTSHRPTKKEIE